MFTIDPAHNPELRHIFQKVKSDEDLTEDDYTLIRKVFNRAMFSVGKQPVGDINIYADEDGTINVGCQQYMQIAGHA